jgi:hypothetical protein
MRLRRSEAAQSDGLNDEHDESDVAGADAKDKGNPNANTSPSAPTTSGTAAAEFAVTLDKQTPSVGLGEETEVTATIQPKNGFRGPVQLAVTGLPAGATADPVTANVVSGPVSAKILIKAGLGANVTAANDNVPLVVKATAGAAEATAPANFKVAPKVTVTIPMNVDALRGASQLRSEYGGEVFAGNGALKTQPGNGIVVSVFNADSKQHVIHGSGAFPHGDDQNPIQPNSFEQQGNGVRTRTLNAGARITAYLHDGNQGQGASFQIQVQNAN